VTESEVGLENLIHCLFLVVHLPFIYDVEFLRFWTRFFLSIMV